MNNRSTLLRLRVQLLEFENGFSIIDGFSFTQPREFAGKWFDLDILNREKTQESYFHPISKAALLLSFCVFNSDKVEKTVSKFQKLNMAQAQHPRAFGSMAKPIDLPTTV
jgi:hypothetical protein